MEYSISWSKDGGIFAVLFASSAAGTSTATWRLTSGYRLVFSLGPTADGSLDNAWVYSVQRLDIILLFIIIYNL